MKVLICDELNEESINRIKAAGHEVTYKTGMSPDELIKSVPGYEVLIVRSRTIVTREVINAANKLKLIVRPGAGLDNIDTAYAQEKSIDIKNTPNATAISTAEHAIGLMIALARNICAACRSVKEGRWERRKYTGFELAEKTLGIIGLGRIGRAVAERANVFRMNVIAYDPFIKVKIDEKIAAVLLPLDTLLSRSDYISLHVPLTPETRHMINSEAIQKMKKGVRLINCSRGGVVDEGALFKAMLEGRIAGAAFDVFKDEPPHKDNPLLALENFIAAPHIGALTHEAQARADADTADIVIKYGER